MDQRQFDAFFEPYARNVDNFYEASYWRLSDEIIRELMRRHLGLRTGQRLLDAGGGTARWALWAAKEFDVEVTVADYSTAMLAQARRNVEQAGESRVRLVRCDMQDPDALRGETFDAAVSIYSMLSFLDRPAAAFDTLRRVLAPGARALIMGHSFANALTSKFGRDRAGVAELRRLSEERVVQWAPHVPPLRVFDSADLRRLGADAGLDVEQVFGVTSIVLPEPEDFTYPYETMSGISRALDDEEYFQFALRQELAVNALPGWVDRGVNLMALVRRP